MKTQQEIAAAAAQGIFTSQIKKKIDVHTNNLLRTSFFTENDRKDVRSRFVELVWRFASKYNPALSSFSTYVECILSRRSKNILDHARCLRDRAFETISLDISTGEDGTTLGDIIPDERGASNQVFITEIRDLLTSIYPRLTPRQKRIFDCMRSGECLSMRGMERLLGIPHTTIEREIKRIRQLCLDAGYVR